jgi:hypothetical protein
MLIETHIPLLEEILAEWQVQIGSEFEGYKNHAYRMIHFCFALHPCNDEERKKIIIAAAFHDIGLWSDGGVDYIPPSIIQARYYLEKQGLNDWITEIELMIDMHHKLKAYDNTDYPLVEIFRKGDLVDFSLGMVKFDLPRSVIKQVKTTFPNVRFHKFLLKGAWAWFSKHPTRLPPFMKW